VIHHRLAGTAEVVDMKFSVNVLITAYRRTKKGFFEIRILKGNTS